MKPFFASKAFFCTLSPGYIYVCFKSHAIIFILILRKTTNTYILGPFHMKLNISRNISQVGNISLVRDPYILKKVIGILSRTSSFLTFSKIQPVYMMFQGCQLACSIFENKCLRMGEIFFGFHGTKFGLYMQINHRKSKVKGTLPFLFFLHF